MEKDNIENLMSLEEFMQNGKGQIEGDEMENDLKDAGIGAGLEPVAPIILFIGDLIKKTTQNPHFKKIYSIIKNQKNKLWHKI